MRKSTLNSDLCKRSRRLPAKFFHCPFPFARMARIRLENIRKVYDRNVAAVQDVTFEVEEGEFVVLVGPSGCGKSTVLRMIAGLESITQGSLYIDRRRVNGVPARDRDVAMVFQNYVLYPHMSVFDNMAFGLKLRGYGKEEMNRRVREAAELLGVETILNRKPEQLSGGQRQRVALGRAIVRKPRMFLFDEPLSNLDAGLRGKMRAEISRLHNRLGTTMIYVTHDQVEAMTMGDRIVVLDKGRIQQIDTPLALYRRPANRFVAGFIGNPAMNFIEGRIVEKGGGPAFEAEGKNLLIPLREPGHAAVGSCVGQAVTLGIRPEDIRMSSSSGALPAHAAYEADFLLDVVEPMGHEAFLCARVGKQDIRARIASQALPEAGRSVRLALDLRKLYFFDRATERAL